MDRRFYFFGIFFTGFYLVIALFQSIIYLLLGAQIFTLQSFAVWFVFVAVVSLAASLILLKYYHYKKYRYTFSTGIIFTIASLAHFIIVCDTFMGGELAKFFTITYLITLAAGILYALSLVFSDSGKRPWLKTAGILIFILVLVLVSTLIWAINSQDAQTGVVLEKIYQWNSLAGNLLFVLFIMNYRSELKLLKVEKLNTSRQETLDALMGLVVLLALIATLFFGQKLTSETLQVFDQEKVTDKAKLLAKPFEARTYVNTHGETLLYRLMKPLNYDPEKKYPLVVCLHHGGSYGNDNIRQIEGSPAALLLSEEVNRKKYAAFLFVPQCPHGSNWGGPINYPAVDSLVFEAINALEKEFSIDEKRRYVTGVSAGGYGTWHFISTRPENVCRCNTGLWRRRS